MPTCTSPTTNVPKNVEQKNEDILNEDEQLNTAPENILSPEEKTIVQQPGTIEKRGIENTIRSDSTTNKRGDKTREYSPPTKQASSSKSVRFKGDMQEDEKRHEALSKQLSHGEGKV